MIHFETYQMLSYVIAGSLWLTFMTAFFRWAWGFITSRPARR